MPTTVRIRISQGVPGPPGTAAAHAPTHGAGQSDELLVESVGTAGAVGSVPTSDGTGALTMEPVGDVTSPGGETAGRVTKFTGSKAIAQTATTETELATAVTHSTTVTGNPHSLDAADVGAEPAGSIATHTADADAHHAESHTLASHSDTATTGAALDAHIASTANPHATDIGNLGTGTLAELNTAISDATVDDVTGARTPISHAANHSDGGSDEIIVEDLTTAGAIGTVPTSDGAGGLSMALTGGGNVTSPGGETAGRVTKFTGSNAIAETATTETQLATAVTHSAIVTGNPHVLDAADVGAEPAGSIATHTADANAHHAESHTIASHSDTTATGAELDRLRDGSQVDDLHTHEHLGPTFFDNTFRIFENNDPTKKMSIRLDGLSPGVTRVVTIPDKNITVDGQSSPRDPNPHASDHSDGGSDEISVESLATSGADGTVPTSDGAGALVMSGPLDFDRLDSNSSTGLRSGGIITINGGDPTKFDVSAGTGWVIDSHSGVPSTITPVSWSALTAVTVTLIATTVQSILAFDSTGSLVQQSGFYTAEQRRDLIVIGGVAHVDFATITSVLVTRQIVFNSALEFATFFDVFGPLNQSGNVYQPNDSNLTIDKTSGSTWAFGHNTNDKIPSIKSDPTQAAIVFLYFFKDSTQPFGIGALLNQTVIDPTIWDDGSDILQTVPNNKWTVQWIFYGTGSEDTVIIIGQRIYNSKDEAIAGISTDTFIIHLPPGFNPSLRSRLVVKKEATDLSDDSTACFFDAGRFGTQLGGGGGGVSTTILGLADVLESTYVGQTELPLKVNGVESGMIFGQLDHTIALSGVGANTHAQIDTHIADTANPHATDIENLGSGTLAELNAAVSDATLDDSSASRTPSAHTIASHSDTTATGAELDTLTGGGNADLLHSHFPIETRTFDPNLVRKTDDADWAVNGGVNATLDTNNAALGVLLFPDTGTRGFGIDDARMPPGSTTMAVRIISRAEVGPPGDGVVRLHFHFREVPDDAAMPSWSTAENMVVLNFLESNENWQKDTESRPIATAQSTGWGLTVGAKYQFQFVRDNTVGSNLSGDWTFLEIALDFT